MSLDLSQTLQQIDSLAQRLDQGRDDRAQRLDYALKAMREADAADLKQKVDGSQGRPYMCASLVDGFADAYGPRELPPDFCVASVDGSHIDVDRHLPVRCYLINVGGCVLTYGSQPDARFFINPTVHSEDADLYITHSSPESRDSVAVDGPLVGLRRAVAEVAGLASAVEEVPPGLPVLALLDGSLVLWGLAGRAFPPFVRDEILQRGLIPALDRLQQLARIRSLALASYISLPQSAEVVNTLRLAACPHDAARCRQSCSSHRSGQTPCDALNGFLDRHLFQELLSAGERSCVYRTNSSISRVFYGPHEAHFYYLNTGEEIARVEMPEWVALDDGLLELSHVLVNDQCRRGLGYPAAIAEAHEQAVVTGQDREAFKQMLEEVLDRNKLPVYTSEKARSKRMRWL